MRNPSSQHTVTVLAIAAVIILSACGSVSPAPTGSVIDTTTTSSAPPTTAPGPSGTDTMPLSSTMPPATRPSDPPPPEPGGDCDRSLRLANIHYQLAFFSICQTDPNGPPFPVLRRMDQPPSLQEKVAMLVAGSRVVELDDGLATGFDSVDERNEIEVVVDVDPAGIATVDFRIGDQRWHPGSRASASAQLASFKDPLMATVFSEPSVTALDKSTLCWGESDCSGFTTRETWEGMLFVNHGVMCDLAHYAQQSWGCTVADAAVTYQAVVVDVASDDVLNMRSGPGVAYFKVGELQPGSTVDVLDHLRPAEDGAWWRLVRTEPGDVGWVNASFLTNAATAASNRTEAEQLADTFVEFAARPSDSSFAALPIADRVALGLGAEVLKSVAGKELRNSSTWTLEMEYFRAYTGPFSAFTALSRTGAYEVTVGPHHHCASPPMPAPDGFEGLTRISIQPASDTIDSCLQWSTVDLFVDQQGDVVAITFDVWEP